MYVELTKEVNKAFVKKDWISFRKWLTDDFTVKLVPNGMTFNQDEMMTILETENLLNPRNSSTELKVFEINNCYSLTIADRMFYDQTDQLVGCSKSYDLMKWNERKVQSVISYAAGVIDFKITAKWLNSLDIEYEVNSLIE